MKIYALTNVSLLTKVIIRVGLSLSGITVHFLLTEGILCTIWQHRMGASGDDPHLRSLDPLGLKITEIPIRLGAN
ncbi:hypothetical protein NQ318_019110 [Aromia moschata]|uniref:Uncharacterized protein n=1 Tax=Aromia moschata TaxID=1265417 RepID=A0AAV8XPZ2_9CUCU|nr:hypothetical protein NQ318_019110 [Aromia moschata]